MTDNFKEIGSLFGREGAGAGFAKQTDKESFFYTYNHLRDALVPKGFYPSTVSVRHPHGLTLEQIKRLPELLERPVVLMDSDRDDTMIAVLADVDEDGFPLIAALRPGGNAVSEGRSVGGTIVCSFYGKPENYFRFKMQQMPQRVLYQDIEKAGNSMREPNFNCLGATSQVPTLIKELYAHRNALSSYEQTPRRWKRMEGKRPACGGNLVTWHPGELHLTREDVRKPPALQKDISIAT